MFCINCGTMCEDYMDGEVPRLRCPSCGYISYKNPYPCVSIIIVNKQGEVALGKRHKDSFCPGKWCLPCGYIEYDETYLAAGIREAKEEVGIDIEPKGIINVVSNQFDNGLSSLVVVLLAYYNGDDELIPGDDITEAAWFDIHSSLPPLAFSADEFVIRKYRDSMDKTGEVSLITLEGSSFLS